MQKLLKEEKLKKIKFEPSILNIVKNIIKHQYYKKSLKKLGSLIFLVKGKKMTIHEFKFPIQKSWRGREEPKPAEGSMEKIMRLEAEVDGAETTTQT